ncbi:hypothetical protein [Bradyrhizobium sp. CCBAU 45389]|uniref:hypothetical protein n=1 Tax=Bradyrhizobium sp. CCBAU 45389 TaxID=858429 RepID=UPI0023064852|nr:hypothetical protein [Bradyrhizobium sp. CCBAU 45389]
MTTHLAYRQAARVAAIGLALGLLTGCLSTSNQAPTTAAPVTPSPPKAGYASVHIGRPFGSNTSVFALPIEVDGKALMSLPPGKYTTVELPPGPHSVGSPNEYWTRVISGIPHPAEFVVEAGKSYYLLPKAWGEDAGYRYTMVGSAVVPERDSINHSTFSVRIAAATEAPPAEFRQLSYTKTQ